MSLSVWRDEVHGRFNRSNTLEDDEGMEDGDNVNISRVTEHSDPDIPPPPFQASLTDLSRVNADTEPIGREVEAAGIQCFEFDGDDEATWRSLENMAEDTSQKVSTSTSAASLSMDHDQEMWDILDQFEKEIQVPSAMAPVTQPIPKTGGPFDPGDEWDDMYL